ncbi:L,D-transpeptidase family protein [Novosphingobium sp. Gsoil 351]|uniref:L,D-transpeptidase family protein n=1 Tax=Novosphingobium sp. Gsoil 351 TaxID=2675225 RepID=UPI001E361E15|nr:L,D-transpeptidase family protein [Novosphingobium sp. Gsoil 351]
MPSPLKYGQFAWNDVGVPKGHAWIRIDLSAQTLSVFRGKHEIGTAVILYGADSHLTPTGRFPILAKFANHRSSLYDAAMPFTLQLTGDGVAIHGSDVRSNAATHGCIGIPEAFARRLFTAVSRGDLVYIIPEVRR